MFEAFAWQDLVLALGSLVGFLTKLYALNDENTTWTRTSSTAILVFYPPRLAAYYTLGLTLTFVISTLNFLTWTGIWLYRAPYKEDLLGREK